jgi:hypothetical protein
LKLGFCICYLLPPCSVFYMSSSIFSLGTESR